MGVLLLSRDKFKEDLKKLVVGQRKYMLLCALFCFCGSLLSGVAVYYLMIRSPLVCFFVSLMTMGFMVSVFAFEFARYSFAMSANNYKLLLGIGRLLESEKNKRKS